MTVRNTKNIINEVSSVSQLGLVVVLCLAIGLFFGYLADKWTEQAFVFKLTGIILGLAAGLWQAYRLVIDKIR